jgi:DNA-binding NarL/FixJ family response regulator
VSQVRVVVYAHDPITALGMDSILRAKHEVQVVPYGEVDAADVVVVAGESVGGKLLGVLREVSDRSSAPVVLVTNELRGTDLNVLLACGVVTVLSRSATTSERLVQVVLGVPGLRAVPPARAMRRLTDQLSLAAPGVLRPLGYDSSGLVAREKELLKLLAEGCETAEIADRLGYSKRMVKKIVHGMLARLGLRNRPHAVAYALRAGAL